MAMVDEPMDFTGVIQPSEERVSKYMDIETMFTYQRPKEGQPAKYEAIREKAKELVITIIENSR